MRRFSTFPPRFAARSCPWDAALFHVLSRAIVRSFYAETNQLLHKQCFTPNNFCRDPLLHKLAFPQTTFYILLHQPALTQTRFYTNQLLSNSIVRPTSFYTNHLCNQLLQTSFYTNQLLPYFTPKKNFYTNIHTWSFRQTAFNANHLVHRPAFTTQFLREPLFRQTNQMAGGFPVCTQLERSPAQQPTKSLAPLPASRCQRAGRRQCEHPDA